VSEPPTLFSNGRFVTLDAHHPRAEWMVVLDERVQRIGSGPVPSDIKQCVDLKGRTVVPGFVDAHAHFFQTGLDMLFVDLSRATTHDALMAKLRAAQGGPRTWLFAHGYEEDKLTDIECITRTELDPSFPERPVWINRIDYHSAVVNTAALRRLNLPPGTDGMLLDAIGVPDGRLRSEAWACSSVG
jgi:predicted amidohydrolase YtcJ